MKKRREFNFLNLLFKEDYKKEKESLKKEIRENFGSRKLPASIIIGEKILFCSLGNVLLNLFLVYPFIGSDIKITTKDVIIAEYISQRDLQNYFNKVLKKFQNENGIDFSDVRKKISDCVYEMTEFSVELNFLAGNTISFYDFLRLANEDPEAEEIFKPKIDYGLQFDQIENRFKNEGKRIEKFYERHPESDLCPFIRSHTGLNIKQLTQGISFVGLKPNTDGSVIPVNIDKNYLLGLENLENYFITAKGTRKALITNKTMTKKSGYLTRKLSLLMMDRFHSNDLKDCGTRHFIVFDVDSEKKLKMIDGRHYYKIDQKSHQKISDELFTVSKDDKDLIGTSIGMRSPITCCGEQVCATCYGRYLSEINKDINTGLAAVFKLTEPLTQKLLSAKHLLSTNTDSIDWGEKFLEYFTVNMNQIFFNELEFSISFKIPDSEDYDEDEDMYSLNSFLFNFPGSKKAVEFISPVSLFINPKLFSEEKIANAENGFITIDPAHVSEDEFIFKFQAKNNELIKSLMEILNLIETKEHLGITDFNEFANRFNDLLIENDMNYLSSVHIEMISSMLIKDSVTGERLDFSKENLNPYEIYRVSKAVSTGPLSISLAFERINEQLVDLNTYKKEETSLMDYLFQ